MGMYTELVIKCDICEDIPQNVKEVLDFLFGDRETAPTNLPDHEFFKCGRWDHIGKVNSYYHIPCCLNFFDGSYLFSRSDFKDYDGEIDKFIDFLDPYIDGEKGQCIGWSWYEQRQQPELIFKK